LEFTITGHIGTHIDCGLHMFNNGFDTGSTLPEHFIGTGIVIDCRACGYQIPEKLLKSEQKRIKKAEFILLYTGWDQFWGKARYFENFPVLNEQAAEFLTRFSLKGIGIDAPSFDTVHSTDLPVHHILLSKGILLVENLTNLKNISESEFIFSCFPLKIQGGDGSPVRAVGIRL
jgi:arylformamidase